MKSNSTRRARRAAQAQERRQAKKAWKQEVNKTAWKRRISVDKEVGKKRYTEGQKNYMRALKVIEKALDKPATDIAATYGSDDIEELANQYYMPELQSYSKEELSNIEKEFNKTHGYHIRIKQGSNPFAGIDFNTLQPSS